MLKLENDGAILIATSNPTTPSVKKMVGLSESALYILDFKVKGLEFMGKGYGKSLFLDFVLNNRDKDILLSPSFSDIKDFCFSGREEMTMDNMESAPINLLNNFYIPVLKKANIKYDLIKGDILKIGAF